MGWYCWSCGEGEQEREMVWLMEGERNEGHEIGPGEDEKLEEKRIQRFLGSSEGWS